MNVVLIRVNAIKTRPQNPHRRCRVIQSVLMNIGRLKTAIGAGLLRQKFKLSKGEMEFTTTPRKLSMKAAPQPLDAVTVSNATARLSSAENKTCRTANGYRSTCAADTTGTNGCFPVFFIKSIFDNCPITKLRADWNQGVLLLSRFMSLASTRWMLGSGKSVKRANNYLPTFTPKAASAKASLPVMDVGMMLNESQATELFPNGDQGMFGIRIRTAVHADLLRQVVFFQLALHG